MNDFLAYYQCQPEVTAEKFPNLLNVMSLFAEKCE